jgi:hypothetical protein
MLSALLRQKFQYSLTVFKYGSVRASLLSCIASKQEYLKNLVISQIFTELNSLSSDKIR